MSSSKSGNIAFPILFTTTPVVVSVNMRTDNSSLYYSQIARAKNNQYFTIPSSSQCDWFAIGFQNGLKIQWGKKDGYTKHINFNINFVSSCVYLNFIANRSSSTENGWHYYYNLTRSDVYIMQNDETALWIAIGFQNGLKVQWGTVRKYAQLPLSYASSNSYRVVQSWIDNNDGHTCYDESLYRIDANHIGSHDGSSYTQDYITIGY